VLLILFVAYLVHRPELCDPARAEGPSEMDLDCLPRLGLVGVCREYDGINSETTRARENPHMRHDVAVTDGLHYGPLQNIGCVDVPQRGEAYY
jgi:hypothetical protein